MPRDVVGVPGERGPQHGGNPDRVLVYVRLHVLGADRVLVALQRHDARLDVEVAAELLPHHVHVAAEYEVGAVARLALRLSPRAPLPLQRQRAEHDRLGGALRARARRLPRSVEEVGEHPYAALLDLRRLRVLGMVDEVGVQRSRDQPVRLGLHPRRHERRQVAHRHAVEQHLFAEQAQRVLGGHAALGQPVVGGRLQPVAVAVRALQLLDASAPQVGRALLRVLAVCLVLGRHSHPPRSRRGGWRFGARSWRFTCG